MTHVPLYSTNASPPQMSLVVCPVSCLNLGSFYSVFGATSSCACAAAGQYTMLSALTTDIRKVRTRRTDANECM